MPTQSFVQQLGIQPEHRVCLRGIKSPAFAAMVCARVDCPPSNAVSGRYDVIVLQVDADDDLARIPTLAKHLEPSGALWVFHAKNDAKVRTAGIGAGLAPNKMCEYNERYAATRYVPRAGC